MEELLERIAAWVRRIVKPDIDPVQERVEKLDKELDQPVPLAPEDVESRLRLHCDSFRFVADRNGLPRTNP